MHALSIQTESNLIANQIVDNIWTEYAFEKSSPGAKSLKLILDIHIHRHMSIKFVQQTTFR